MKTSQLQESQLHLKQQQLLIVSPEMQKALYLLQLPVQELSTVIADEMEQNPLLEYADNDFEHLKETEDKFRTLSSYVKREEEDVKTIIENTLVYEYSLYEVLLKQASEIFTESESLTLAKIVIGHIDEKGFLLTPLSEIAHLANTTIPFLEKLLSQIQLFDPPGVGARSMKEVLLIQLRKQEKEDSLAFQIVDQCFDLMIHNKIPHIAEKLKKSNQLIQKTIQTEISRLDLHPGTHLSMGHYKQHVQTITPDVSLQMVDGKVSITIHDEKIPSLKLNELYLKMLKDESLPKETRHYIQEKIMSGKWLLRNLFERQNTIYRIAEQLVEKQSDFLFDPKGQLAPCTMKDIASILSLHESTIARAVANKYVNCPRGLLPLRSFFTHAFTTEEGENVSVRTVKELLLELLKTEDKSQPLSDEELSIKMKEKGIPCARRTIAKYRQELKIGNTLQRRIHR